MAADLPTVSVEHLYYLVSRGERVGKLRADEMVDYCIAVDGTDNSCENNPPFYTDTSPDGNRIVDNEVTGNGSDPPPGPFESVAGDLLGIGGTNNCASGNTATKVLLTPELPAC